MQLHSKRFVFQLFLFYFRIYLFVIVGTIRERDDVRHLYWNLCVTLHNAQFTIFISSSFLLSVHRFYAVIICFQTIHSILDYKSRKYFLFADEKCNASIASITAEAFFRALKLHIFICKHKIWQFFSRIVNHRIIHFWMAQFSIIASFICRWYKALMNVFGCCCYCVILYRVQG